MLPALRSMRPLLPRPWHNPNSALELSGTGMPDLLGCEQLAKNPAYWLLAGVGSDASMKSNGVSYDE
jgi:hypothetical protein